MRAVLFDLINDDGKVKAKMKMNSHGQKKTNKKAKLNGSDQLSFKWLNACFLERDNARVLEIYLIG